MRRRIVDWSVVVVVLALLGAAVIGEWLRERHATRSRTRVELTRAVEALAPRAAFMLANSPAEAAGEVARWAAASGLRVTIISPDGQVLVDSWAVPELLNRFQNHRERPEIQAAERGEVGFARRLSVSTDRPTTYVARVVGPLDAPLGFVRVAREDPRIGWPWALSGFALLTVIAAGAVAAWRRRRAHAEVFDRLRELTDLPAGSELAAVATDVVTRTRATLDTLRREQEGARAALDQVSEGVILLDAQGMVREHNPAAVRLLGSLLVAGRPLVEAVRSPDLLAAVQAVLGGGDARHTCMVSPDGAELSIHVRPLSGHGLAALLVVHDCRQERQLERARRALVADLAHELRTPITVLGGISEELGEENADRELVASLDRQVRRLRAFAEDLEELVALESGQVRLRLEQVDAVAITRAVLRDLGGRAAEAGVEITHEGEPLRVGTDPVRLAQVLTNLVDNGIRYNRPGGHVWVRTSSEGERARIEVEDDGIGIPASEVPLVFQRFYRVQRGEGPKAGSGLGLAIVKHLTRAMGITVDLASEQARGTTVTLTFSTPGQIP